MEMTRAQLASYIDHTLLHPDAVEADIRRICREAGTYRFASVCIHPIWVSLCAELLAGTGVQVCTVVGFPLGAMKSQSKAFEAALAVSEGAGEIDMVLPVGLLKEGRIDLVKQDIAAVREACPDSVLKVIIEACLLSDEQKIQACRASAEASADFVKTSTGFSRGGALLEDVRLMRQTVGEALGVKAAGGVRSLEDALQFIRAGATRLGSSAGVSLMEGAAGSKGEY